jgi:DNA mismatch repair protein MSH2
MKGCSDDTADCLRKRPENKPEPDLDPAVIEEGTRVVEELLRTWAARSPSQDGEDVFMADGQADESPETQLEALKKCVDAFRPRLEGNAWVQRVLTTLT